MPSSDVRDVNVNVDVNWWLRFNYFRFCKKNKRPPYWNSTSGFDFDHVPEISTLFWIRLPNFVQIEAPIAEIWHHIHFLRWRPRRLNTTSGFTTSGFVSVDVSAFRRSKSISQPILSRYLKLRLRYNYFRFRNTNVRHIGILLLISISTSWHVILHQATEFRPNPSTHCGNMTSYLFLKMAAATAKYYFRFRICWCRCLQKVKVYHQTKFRRYISIGGWDITTSAFEIQASAILEFYYFLDLVDSRPFRRTIRIILHKAAEFRPNRNIRRWNMTSYRF